jgi:hypothetical protein
VRTASSPEIIWPLTERSTGHRRCRGMSRS